MPGSSWDILLINDDAGLLLSLGDRLRSRGFSVLVAQDASRGLEQLENLVAIVVLDVDLAGEDGLQLMEFVKANYPHIPVILYTDGIHAERDVEEMLERGAETYINTRRPVEELYDAIDKIRKQ